MKPSPQHGKKATKKASGESRKRKDIKKKKKKKPRPVDPTEMVGSAALAHPHHTHAPTDCDTPLPGRAVAPERGHGAG